MSTQPSTVRGAAVVTGASSGIGAAFARDLIARGHPVVAVARRADRLDALAAWARRAHRGTLTPVVADLATEAGLAKTRAAVDALALAPEVLVLNAGFGTRGRLADLPRPRGVDMVRVNCVAVADLAAHVLPGMVAAGRGAIVVVASAAAYQPIPHMAGYAATKAFGLHLADALARELEGTGVRAVAVCPGPTRTEFSTAAGSRIPLPWFVLEEPETVVRAAWRALAAGRSQAPVGIIARSALAVGYLLPQALVVRAAGVIHRTRVAVGGTS